MMKIEKFKKELFEKLLFIRKTKHPRLISIGHELFSGTIEDMTIYMDFEMQQLVTNYPYQVSFVACESGRDHLTFIDIIPEIRNNEGVIEQKFFYYDCEKHQIGCFVQHIEP